MTDRPNRLPRRPGPDAQIPEQEPLDLLSDVFRCVRLTGAIFFLVDASPPWLSQAPAASVFTEAALPGAQHLISYHVVTRGECWAGLTGAEPQHLIAGDILVIPHGDPYFLSDLPPGRQPACNTDESVSFFRRMAAGTLPTVVTVGSGGARGTRFICGFLGCDRRPFNPVLAALPPVIHLRRAAHPDERLNDLMHFAERELRDHGTGSREVLLRLSELMFITAVRRYIRSMPDAESGWLAGLRDPVVAKVLALLHGEPAQPWTLERLASRVGASRSVLAERFTRIVGQPPMRYLAAWRMQRAAGLLADGTTKVGAVAAAVGYDSEAAFSRAFSRLVGMSPGRWRQGKR